MDDWAFIKEFTFWLGGVSDTESESPGDSLDTVREAVWATNQPIDQSATKMYAQVGRCKRVVLKMSSLID